MELTHYERMVTSKRFNVPELIKVIEEELPAGEPNYIDFMKTSVMERAASLVHVYGSNIMTMAQVAFHIYCYYAVNGRTYEVHENIGEMLLNTDLNVDTSLVKAPFTEIQVMVPKLLQIRDPQTGLHDVCQLYIHLNEQERVLRVLSVGAPNEKSVDAFDDATFFFRVPLDKGKVSECLDSCMANWNADPLKAVYGSENDQRLPRLYRFALNILMYITSSDADIRMVGSKYGEMAKKLGRTGSKSKKARIRQRMASESRESRYFIGRGIQLTHEESNLYGALRAAGGKHSVRYPVGGHWRKQWYGSEGSKFQKLKWIRPHLRGPELAELVKSVGTLR